VYIEKEKDPAEGGESWVFLGTQTTIFYSDLKESVKLGYGRLLEWHLSSPVI